MSNRVAYLASEDITNNLASRIFYGELKLIEPVRFRHKTGKRWTDMLARTHDILPFFSEKVIQLFEENNLSGWEKYEVELENRESGISDKYYGFVVKGRCKNNLKTIVKDKKIIDWDGNDFFTMNGTSYIFISEKVQQLLNNKKLKITNIEMEPFDDLLMYFIDEKAYFKKKFG
jgi:hypothetical protein